MLALTQGMMALAAAASAAPVLEEITTSTFSATTTAHNVSYPASVAAGDLIIALVSARGATAITTPSGFVDIGSGSTAGNGVFGVYYATAAGTEGGSTVNFVTGTAATMAAQIWRIRAGTWSSVPQAAITASTSSSTPNSPSLASGWGGLDVFFIAWFGANAVISMNTFPYASNQTFLASGGTNQVTAGACSTISSAGTLDPPAFSVSASVNHRAFTVAIRPA
jgi:hypothetical protein